MHDLQPDNERDTSLVLREKLRSKLDRYRDRQNRSHEAHVRKLLKAAEKTLTEDTEVEPERVLAELHLYLRADTRLPHVLDPQVEEPSQRAKVRFKRYADARGKGISPPPVAELETYAEIAAALGYIHGVTDLTRYAPVRMEALDIAGVDSSVAEGEATPVGRWRIAHDSERDADEEVVIPHKDCEHLLLLADPRKGKDSTGVSICANLHEEHGYKYFSLHDDGRNETPAMAIPNDETPIQKNLDEFGQEPRGLETAVFVPAIDLPDELPANFEPFTLGLASLTPEIITALAYVDPASSTEQRIKHALDQSLDGSGTVDELIDNLEKFADETTAEITVREAVTEDEADELGLDDGQYTRTYTMGEDDYLKQCAEALMQLAAEGLVADEDAPTNLDMVEEMQKDRVAVLNCNFLDDSKEGLKYTLINLWLRMIYRARDTHPGKLPRAVCELRELKSLAPSKLTDVKYRKQIKAVMQTLFLIGSQGGSRRILLVGSSQKLNDIYKALRTNMPIKLLLQLSQEKVTSLKQDAGYSFTDKGEEYIQDCGTGMGMLISHGEKYYPIQWRGAPCGLGLGDMVWEHRYGMSMGYRVRTAEQYWDGEKQDARAWIDEDGRVYDVDELEPEYGEWYLLDEDIPEPMVPGDDIDVQPVIAERREYPLPMELGHEQVSLDARSREMRLIATAEAEQKQKETEMRKYGIQGHLADWIEVQPGTRSRWLKVLRAVRDEFCQSHNDIHEITGIPTGTISRWARREGKLKGAFEKDGDGVYQLTRMGERALEVPWGEVAEG